MNEITFLELPLITFDAQKNRKEKPVSFESSMFQGKLIRDFEKDGKVVENTCVVSRGLRVVKGEGDNLTATDDYWIFGLSRPMLLARLQKAGLAKVA